MDDNALALYVAAQSNEGEFSYYDVGTFPAPGPGPGPDPGPDPGLLPPTSPAPTFAAQGDARFPSQTRTIEGVAISLDFEPPGDGLTGTDPDFDEGWPNVLPSLAPVPVHAEADVLFGRGGLTNAHPGNVRYRAIVASLRPDYASASRLGKPRVARRIVQALRGKGSAPCWGGDPARFLRRSPVDGRWYDVGDAAAAEKVSQGLREVPREVRAARARQLRQDRRRAEAEEEGREAEAMAAMAPPGMGLMGGPIAAMPERRGQMQVLQPSPMVTQRSGLPPGSAGLSSDGSPGSPGGGGSGGEGGIGGGSPGGSPPARGVVSVSASIVPPPPLPSVLLPPPAAVPTGFDVLCDGTGTLVRGCPGSRRFLDLVAQHRPLHDAADQADRPGVALLVIHDVRMTHPCPGRFLGWDPSGGGGRWEEMGDDDAFDLVLGALRDRLEGGRKRGAGSGAGAGAGADRAVRSRSSSPAPSPTGLDGLAQVWAGGQV
jgi:hypothetical protein